MQRICKSLRTVSDTEFVGQECSEVGLPKEAVPSFQPISISNGSSQTALSEGNLNSAAKMPLNVCSSKNDQIESNSSNEQVTSLRRISVPFGELALPSQKYKEHAYCIEHNFFFHLYIYFA
jgi:hypothetical protein